MNFRVLVHVMFAAWMAGGLCFGEEGAGPYSPGKALGAFVLADPGLRVELVAAEPLVESPCALAFGNKGELYVAENRGYPNTAEPPQGRIALLRDKDGDGVMDQRTTFAEGLTFPNGVLPWRDGLIVTCAPDVLFLRDTNGDGVADERRVLLTGFDTTGSTQLRVNAPTLGPDGWIYFAAGLRGGMIISPEHPERAAVKMTGDLRWQPFTGAVENVDGRSQYGQSFDDFGRRFICMNRLPVQQVVLESRWLRRNPLLAFSDTVQDCNERVVKTGLRGGGDGVQLFPLSQNVTTADSHAGSFSAACGVLAWRGQGLPERYRGAIFACDPTANLVHLDRLIPRGATCAAEPFFAGREFLASPDDWFRPVFLANGPDDALYIADMTRKTIEHPDYLPEEVRKRTDFETGKKLGRIWRVKGGTPKLRLEHGMSGPELLKGGNAWVRDAGFRGVIEAHKKGAVEGFRALLEDGSPATRAAVLQMLAADGVLDAEALQKAWDAGSADLRGLVLELWLAHPSARAWKPDPAVLGNEPDAQVRFHAALALGDIPEGLAALAQIAVQDSEDRWTRAAVVSSIGGREGDFLAELRPLIKEVTPGMLDLLVMIGKYTPGASAVAPEAATGERQRARLIEIALLLGQAERTREILEPGAKEQGLGALLEAASELAGDGTRAARERVLGVRLLGHATWKLATGPLQKALTDADEVVRAAAVRALAGFGEAEAATILLAEGRWSAATPAGRETLLAALLEKPAHLPAVLAAIESGRLPASAISSLRRPLFTKHPEAGVRARAEKVFSGIGGDRQKAFTEAKAALALTGKGGHGREVFRLLCATCHRLDREGHAVGPDLLDMRNQTKENILYHLVVPDAEIAPAFAAYVAETKDGRALSGILASETPTSITLRGPLTQEQQVLRADLKKLEAAPGSLMPGGLEQGMSKQDLADLIAYLKGEGEGN
jgi:putative membrane-bound dehydrogenase-like protein